MMMKTLLAPAALALLWAGCVDTRPCKEGTLYVTLTLDADAATADVLHVEVTLDGATLADDVAHRPGDATGTLEVDFPAGYPTGKSISVEIDALVGSVVHGSKIESVTLPSGCSSLALAIGAFDAGTPDDAGDGGSDGGGSPPDLITAQKANGVACGGGGECVSGRCVDGVCCNLPCDGKCEACDVAGSAGTCSAVIMGQPHGTRGDCTGTAPCMGSCTTSSRTACTYPGSSVSCRAQSCTGSTKTLAAGCDAAGSCPVPQTINCGTTCSGNDCLGACGSDATCATATPYCNNGVCLATKPIARACAASAECTSNQCADGVCCNVACAGKCEACDVSGNVGSCQTVISGQPHGTRGACAGSGVCKGTCDGASNTACGFAGAATICSAQSCPSGTSTRTDQAGCDGAGGCSAPTMTSCGAFLCSGNDCPATCSVPSDCVSGSTCFGTACCTPDCAGKSCGSDGCGGTCGSGCTFPQKCSTTGSCCTSSCGTSCGGPDTACGGTCTCGFGDRCYNGTCCTPQCDGCRQADTCGGQCPGPICVSPQHCCGGVGCTTNVCKLM